MCFGKGFRVYCVGRGIRGSVIKQKTCKAAKANHADGINLYELCTYEGGDKQENAAIELPRTFCRRAEVLFCHEQQGCCGNQPDHCRAQDAEHTFYDAAAFVFLENFNDKYHQEK